MKFLIWSACAAVYSVITTALSFADITLGGIPTVILAGLCMFLAQRLCNAWDRRKSSRSSPNVPKEPPHIIELDPTSPVDDPYPMWPEVSKEEHSPAESASRGRIAYPIILVLMGLMLVGALIHTRSLEKELKEQEAYIDQLHQEQAAGEEDLNEKIRLLEDQIDEMETQLPTDGELDSQAFADGYFVGYYRAFRGEPLHILAGHDHPDSWKEVLLPSEYYEMDMTTRDYIRLRIRSLRREALEKA